VAVQGNVHAAAYCHWPDHNRPVRGRSEIGMRVLVACEESQAITKTFRARGHEAFSADLQACSGGHPEWHIQGDVFDVIDDGWDLMIAHPPCCHLAVSGASHFEKKRADGRQQDAIDMFMRFTQSNIPRVCIENPVCIMSSVWRVPDQIVQPYYFGDPATKTTCLWLKGLPLLMHFPQDDLFDSKTHVYDGGHITLGNGKRMSKWFYETSCLPQVQRPAARSKTFTGIATAMAEQWSHDER